MDDFKRNPSSADVTTDKLVPPSSEVRSPDPGRPADLPPGTPLTGRIPLPPHRPKVFAMADGPIPLPRRRPADAGTASDPPPDSGNFFTHLFGQTH